MKEYEELYPDLNRRTLQHELKEMINKKILASEGAIHHLIYRLSKFLWQKMSLSGRLLSGSNNA